MGWEEEVNMEKEYIKISRIMREEKNSIEFLNRRLEG